MEELYLNRTPMVFGGEPGGGEDLGFRVIGVPFDSTASYVPGARFGPSAVREASASLEFYSFRSDVDLDRYRIPDLGDVAVVHGDAEETVKRVRAVVEGLASKGLKPAVLGGEHTVSIGSIQALGQTHHDLAVLVLDAHLDLRENYLGYRYSHASAMRRVGERLGFSRLYYLGVRAASGEEVSFARQRGIPFITPAQLRRLGLREVLRRLQRFVEGRPFYISIDMDVFDPAYAPGVGTPEPDGLEPWLVLDLISTLTRSEGFVGMDVVETNPLVDPGRATAALAARLVLEALAGYAKHALR